MNKRARKMLAAGIVSRVKTRVPAESNRQKQERAMAIAAAKKILERYRRLRKP